MIETFQGKIPIIHPNVFIAKNATVIGDVKIEEQASIWFQTVIRGDLNSTYIGKRSNIQDLSVIHQSPTLPVIIEDDVTIGHQVTIHACTVKKNALIGMGSMVMDGSVVGENALVGAGSLLSPNTIIPPYTLALGRPAKVIRELTEEDIKEMKRIKTSYVEKGIYYLNETNMGNLK